jgi:predicted  nucleic acid-binding Zn-ribbon protein
MVKANASLQQSSTTRASTQEGGHSQSLDKSTYQSYVESHLQRMRKEIETTTRLLEHERRRLYLVEEATERVQAEYEEKRNKLRLAQTQSADESKVQATRLRDLEGQLDKAIQKLNACNERNDKYHDAIDKQRKERLALDHVYKRLQREIKEARNEIEKNCTWIDEHQQAIVDHRETVQALKKQQIKERHEFEQQTRVYQEELQNGETIRKEMAIGGWSESRGGGTGKKKGYMVADEEDKFSDQVMYRRILKLAFLNTIHRRHIKQHQKNIEVFEQAFATIKSTTGISDIEDIVKIFVKLEERNFSLLTYVNQLNREIESIDLKNRDLKAQRDQHRAFEEMTREKKDLLVSSLERQMQQTVLAQEDLEQDIKNKLEVLEAIRPSCIKACEQLRKAFGPHPSIPFPNRESSTIGELLTYIEKQVLLYADNIPADAPMMLIKAPPSKSKSTAAKPPELTQFIAQQSNLEDEEEDDDEGVDRVMPMSRVDLKAAAERSIAKRRKGRQHRKGGEDQLDKAEKEDRNQDTLTFDTMVEKSDDAAARRASVGGAQDLEDEDVDRKWRKEKA